ncbi:MAG: hypothetical protein WC516_07015 [Patescibacteria group bacterium]|jgi:hypothetical protein
MSEKNVNITGKVTGFMTVSDSNKLPLSVKHKVISAPAGQVRKFRKVLIDPETGEEVVIEGRAYIGGLGKDGEPIGDRKQSLTCRIAFRVKNLLSVLSEGKVTAVSPSSPAAASADEILNALL